MLFNWNILIAVILDLNSYREYTVVELPKKF